MRAVNLIPSDSRRGGGGVRSPAASFGLAHAVLALLAVAVVFVAVSVLTTNTINERKAKVASLQAQVAQANAQAAALQDYAKFASLAQQRADTVRQITSSRFDWETALANLSKVVPANTSLQALLGTAASGASVGGGTGGSGAGTSGLRSAIAAPAFELRGCTDSQDDVARLLSRLRAMDGVTRVTLSDSQKGTASQAATAVSATGGTGSNTGCKPEAATFDLVIFFTPLPSAGPNGLATPVAAATPAAAGSPTPAVGGTATPVAGTPTTPAATAPTTPTTPAAGTATTPAPTSQPVSNTTTTSGG